MRPKKLVISAFGPYAGLVNIDFDLLGDKGLYLISGNTGAGKSTIFEAIRFALYGDDSSELRSKYAESSISTYVELTFTLRGQEYYIKRNPKYMRPKTRGEGYTEAKADGELILPDGKVIAGYAAVTQKITDILGLNTEQFSKIVMIAQGKFRELLVADTASRSKIFRDIFKTSSYDVLQRKVKTQFLDSYKAYGKINDSIKQYVQGISYGDDFEQADRLKEIAAYEVITDIDEVKEIISKLNDLDETVVQDNSLKIEQVQRKLTDAARIKASMEAMLSLIRQLLDAYEEKRDIMERAGAIENSYNEELAKQPKREKLLVQIEKEKENVKKYQVYSDKCKEVDECKIKEKTLEKKIQNLQSTEKERSKEFGLLKESLKNSEGLELRLSEAAAVIKELELQLKAYEKIIELCGRYKNAIDNHNKMAEIYLKKRAVAEEKKEIYDIALRGFLDAQAGIMAERLRDNPTMPCPVCGSTEHVKLAESMTKVVSESDVNNAKRVWEEATADAVSASERAGAAAKEKEREEQLLGEAIAEAGMSCQIEDALQLARKGHNEYSDKKEKLMAEREEINKAIAVRSNQLTRFASLEKQLEEVASNIKLVEADWHQCQLNIKSLEGQVEQLKNELSSTDIIEAAMLLKEKENIYAKLVDDFAKVSEAWQTHSKKKTETEAVISQLIKQIKSFDTSEIQLFLSADNEEKLAEQCKELTEYITAQNEKINNFSKENEGLIDLNNQIFARLSANKAIAANIASKEVSLVKEGEKLREIKSLSDTLNGALEGKERVNLETFVQISYFEQVIRRANIKLFEMTEGQYEFKREQSGEDKRSRSGLELNVYDHYNGTIRSVRTLSGGESFMASLSLALGMADIIEESASGIAIDTMFIDEGFGSLDEAALEQAMKVLARLSEGNKLVGIISHVGSLRERIDKQICVTKAQAGGSTAVVCI